MLRGLIRASLTLLVFSASVFCDEGGPSWLGAFDMKGGRFSIKDDRLANQGGLHDETLLDFGEDVGIPRDCRPGCEGRETGCDLNDPNPVNLTCIDWMTQTTRTETSLRITVQRKLKKNNYSKLSIAISHRAEKNISLCIPLDGEMLYGGPLGDAYPSQFINKKLAPYVTGEESTSAETWTGPVAETKWLTSGGRAIHVKPGSPLFVSQNSSYLCLYVINKSPYPKNAKIRLEYDLCLTENAKEAWKCLNGDHLQKPIAQEYEYVVREPIWSTWVAYKANISQQTVMDFANKIQQNKLRMGVMEIDDKWESCYGSQEFDPEKFPNPKKMIEELHNLGAKVTFWIHPFVNTNCKAFQGIEKHLFKLSNGSTGLTSWWNGQAGLVNFLQKDTFNFFKKRLEDIKTTYGADGYKFDAGEAYYIPALFQETPLTSPNEFTRTYVKLAEGFGQATEVRVGAESSSFDLFLRILDTNTDWALEDHGLKSVLTTTLQLSALGYRAIMPDMIGGNCYGQVLDKELFIRWVQLTTFLPVMQFSYQPWNFDEETVNITRMYIELHHQYSDFMLKSLNNTNGPLIAPIWWLDPNSPTALEIFDEFLVGDGDDWILVAPIVEKGGRSRTIYLPPGLWTDGNDGQSISGPVTLPNYPAPLDKLPYFKSSPTAERTTPESDDRIFVIANL